MNELQLNLNIQFEKMCKALNLGKLIKIPQPISGGYLHKLYKIETTQGIYAIKMLNPKILLRPKAMRNFINSEKIANIASNFVPALPAKIINGSSIQKIDNQFLLVFDWVEGMTLKQSDISSIHCELMGSTLACIHKINFSILDLINESFNIGVIDWSHYLQKGYENNAVWLELYSTNLNKISKWENQAIKSIQFLSDLTVISHRDLDSKNVLWNNNDPLIIDWESAGYVNPMQEMIETAIYWSETETGELSKERFLSFVKGYQDNYGQLQADWNIVLSSGYAGKLGWLEYNLKRSLWLECTDEIEQQLGNKQVIKTINALIRYEDMVIELAELLKKV